MNCLMSGYGASCYVFSCSFFLLAFCYKMSWKLTRVNNQILFQSSLNEIWKPSRPSASFSFLFFPFLYFFFSSPFLSIFFPFPSFFQRKGGIKEYLVCERNWFLPSLIVKCCVVLGFTKKKICYILTRALWEGGIQISSSILSYSMLSSC